MYLTCLLKDRRLLRSRHLIKTTRYGHFCGSNPGEDLNVKYQLLLAPRIPYSTHMVPAWDELYFTFLIQKDPKKFCSAAYPFEVQLNRLFRIHLVLSCRGFALHVATS